MDKINKFSILLLILVAVCVISRPVDAETSIYVFDPSQSTVVKTGGFAGVNITYAVTGQYRLSVDSDTGVALFETVNANLTDETGAEYGRNLEEIFNMTGLDGVVIGKTTIDFKGKTADGTESDVRLTLSFIDGLSHMTGNTTPPPNSADMFLFDVNAVATRKYAGGTGEPNNPYQIATAEDLITLGETPEDYDKNFILTADIDLDPNLPGRKVFDRAVIAPDTNDATWEFEGTPFTGVFDGQGYRIHQLQIDGNGHLGLWGQLDNSAKIANLSLVDANVVGTGDNIGLLVGLNNGSVSNCYVTGAVAGERFVGGLVGVNEGGIVNSYSTGTVTGVGAGSVGGLVGDNHGSITMSYSICTITGNGCVGGLVGDGRGSSSIANSYSAGMVTGYGSVGGLIGHNDEGSIANSYSTGMVTGNSIVGGLVGYNEGDASITASYSTGKVTGVQYVGGLVGYTEEGITPLSFWDIETSGQTTSAEGTGKNTAEMQTASTFLEAGWDFVGEIDNGTGDIWSICEKTNYPRFVWQIPVGDFVCPDGVTIEDFAFFMAHWLDDNCDSSNGYCEGTDLDQSGSVDAADLQIFFDNWPDKN